MRRLISLLVSCFLFCGCAAGPKVDAGPPISDWEALYPEVVDPARDTDGPRGFFRARLPGEAEQKTLDAAVAAYVANDEAAFAEHRDALVGDPIGSFWLTRTLVLFVIAAREAKATSTSTMVAEPVWERPIRHLVAMGDAAVPAIVIDLLRAGRSDRVKLGGELLDRIGPSGFDRWSRVLSVDDTRARRRLTEVVAGWDAHDPAMLVALRAAAGDDAFGVRGAAFLGLAKSGASDALVFDALQNDPDPYVRRKIVEGLGSRAPARDVADVLVATMEQASIGDDSRLLFAADDALRRMSGRRERGTVTSWRAWLSTLR